MAKAEWGVKRVCPSCGARYYDMRKNPPVCPNCSTAFDPEALLRSRRKAVPEDKVKRPVPAAAPVEEAAEVEPAAEGEAEAPIEDAAELGDEESELGEVVEIEEEGPPA